MNPYDHKLFEFEYVLYGNHALFTNPLTRMLGSKYSYQVPTYSALEGITKSIYWKPSVLPVIENVKILNEIDYQIENVRLRPADGSSQLGQNMLLKNVKYVVKGYYIPAPNAEELGLLPDALNHKKHETMFNSALSKGGRKPIFLGASDYIGYVRPLDDWELQEPGFYNGKMLNFGMMFLRYGYPEQVVDKPKFLDRYYMTITAKDGIINFPLIKVGTDDIEIPENVKVDHIPADECRIPCGAWYRNRKKEMQSC